MKPKLKELWRRFAGEIATLSTCERTPVGCVLTSVDGERGLAFGYNGGLRGGPNHPPKDSEGTDFWVHAEANALVKSRPAEDFVAFCTHSPCYRCAQLLINSGCKMVHWETPYRDPSGLYLLRAARLETQL